MNSLAYIPASDGAANASLMTVTNVRSGGATTIQVNTVANAPTKFYASYGTPHTFTDPVTGETITVISEATAVDFAGHIDGSNVEIDEIAPGYTDNGNEVGDIIVIRPVTEWANNIFNTLSKSLNDDGTLIRPTLGETEYFTTPGANTWTKPDDLKYVIVEVQGGGGGGSPTAATGSSQLSAAGGGGGGGYARKKILAADLGATETVTVGGASESSTNGTPSTRDGKSSSFGAHCSATGGSGGSFQTAAVTSTSVRGYITHGADGGGGTGGDINIPGNPGEGGWTDIDNNNKGYGGSGGNSVFGAGGKGMAAVATGVDATGYGGGGGGAATTSSQSVKAGGIGSQGIVIVHEYF